MNEFQFIFEHCNPKVHTYLKVHTRLLSKRGLHLSNLIGVTIPLCKGLSDLMKFPSFIWNYLVASKKVWEISSYFYGLLRIYHEVYYDVLPKRGLHLSDVIGMTIPLSKGTWWWHNVILRLLQIFLIGIFDWRSESNFKRIFSFLQNWRIDIESVSSKHIFCSANFNIIKCHCGHSI